MPNLNFGVFFLTSNNSFLHIKQNRSILRRKYFSAENFNQIYAIKKKVIH